LIPSARADAHQRPPTLFRSTTSRNNGMRRRVPVNDGLRRGFQGICDTVLTQHSNALRTIRIGMRAYALRRTPQAGMAAITLERNEAMLVQLLSSPSRIAVVYGRPLTRTTRSALRHGTRGLRPEATASICQRQISCQCAGRGSDVKISREEARRKGGKHEQQTEERNHRHARRTRRLDGRVAAARRVRVCNDDFRARRSGHECHVRGQRRGDSQWYRRLGKRP